MPAIPILTLMTATPAFELSVEPGAADEVVFAVEFVVLATTGSATTNKISKFNSVTQG